MTIDGYDYNTVEHYYQSKKFDGTKYEHIVRNARNPSEAKQLAYSDESKKFFDPKWDSKKLIVMGKALKKKFSIDRFRNLLLSTDNREIVEYSKHDFYWGRDEHGAGANMLGRLLMEIREEIKTKESKKFF
jgi:hypothetical protein